MRVVQLPGHYWVVPACANAIGSSTGLFWTTRNYERFWTHNHTGSGRNSQNYVNATKKAPKRLFGLKPFYKKGLILKYWPSWRGWMLWKKYISRYMAALILQSSSGLFYTFLSISNECRLRMLQKMIDKCIKQCSIRRTLRFLLYLTFTMLF